MRRTPLPARLGWRTPFASHAGRSSGDDGAPGGSASGIPRLSNSLTRPISPGPYSRTSRRTAVILTSGKTVMGASVATRVVRGKGGYWGHGHDGKTSPNAHSGAPWSTRLRIRARGVERVERGAGR